MIDENVLALTDTNSSFESLNITNYTNISGCIVLQVSHSTKSQL